MKTGLADNAILRFGLKMRAKQTSSVVMISIVTAIASLIMAVVVIVMNAGPNPSYPDSQTGQILYFVFMSLHLALMFILCPAVSGSAISSEREQQTLDMLVCSQMTPMQIITGKFLSSLSWIGIVTVSLLPAFAVMSVVGGVSALSIAAALIFNIWLAAGITSLAVFYSSKIKRTGGAIVLTYITLIGIVFVDFILSLTYYGIEESIYYAIQAAGYMPAFNLHIPVPLFINPILGYVMLVVALIFGGSTSTQILSEFVSGMTVESWNWWVIIAANVVFYSALAFLLLRSSARSIDPMRESRRAQRRAAKQNRRAAKLAAKQGAGQYAGR